MQFDPDRVRENAAKATVEDLLDRVTVYRSGMEPEALHIIEAELLKRGLGPREIDAHGASTEEALLDSNGLALSCAKCHKPAVGYARSTFKLFGILPFFPRVVALCAEHLQR
jgi:hypothetical protein